MRRTVSSFDPYNFFEHEEHRVIAREVMELLHEHYDHPDLWKEAPEQGDAYLTPPYLMDSLVLEMMAESGLMWCELTAKEIALKVRGFDAVIEKWASREDIDLRLHPDITPEMLQRAAELKCHLGFFRPHMLKWEVLDDVAGHRMVTIPVWC
jgi:hypothetical protein